MNTVFCFSVLFMVETEQGYNFWFLQSDWSVSVLFHCKGLAITFCYLPSLPPPPFCLSPSFLPPFRPSFHIPFLTSLPPSLPPSFPLPQAIIHPDTGKKIFMPFRMSGKYAAHTCNIQCYWYCLLPSNHSKSRMGASNNGCGLLGVTNNR